MPVPDKSSSHKSKRSSSSDSSSHQKKALDNSLKKRKFDHSRFQGNNNSNSNNTRGTFSKTKSSSSTTTTTLASAAALPSNKKRALKAERQSHRKHATTVRSSKEVWNELRVKKNDQATIQKLCTELHYLLQGKYMEVAMQHDASRCVQGVLQFGSEKQRREVVMELCDVRQGTERNGSHYSDRGNNMMNLAELCKIQYAHFVVLKMIKYCARDEVCVELIVKSLKKHITKLAVHSVGSRVLELLFSSISSKATAPLKLELYGPQYALFASTTPIKEEGMDDTNTTVPSLPTLATFIANNPDKRESTLTHLQTLLQKGLDKSLTGFAYFHSLLLDYTSIASPNDIRSFLAPALAEQSLHLLSTRAGTRVVCECCAYGTVKDRKRILKCLKGYTRSSLLHRDAYMAIVRLCDVMDDTVLVNKMLLAELHRNSEIDKTNTSGGEDVKDKKDEEESSPIRDLVLSETGSKLFLLLLTSKDDDDDDNEEEEDDDTMQQQQQQQQQKKKLLVSDEKYTKSTTTAKWQKYFDPYELSILHRNPVITENGDDAVPTSKKADETRRQELLVYLKDLLVEVCTKHTEEIMRNIPGSRVLMQVCENFPSEELFHAIIEACVESNVKKDSSSTEDEKEAIGTLLEDPVGHRTLKNLFLAESKRGYDDDDDDAPSLARMFLSKFTNSIGKFALSNRGAFVLSALLTTCVKEDVKNALKSHKKNIAKLAKGDTNKAMLAGFSVLCEALK